MKVDFILRIFSTSTFFPWWFGWRPLTWSRSVARFLWAKIVQNRLNEHERTHANHRIRKQRGRLLPTGGRPSQFYDNPEQWGGSPCLIPIPKEDIARLVAQYVPHNLFVFCDPAIHNAATDVLSNLGNPQLGPENGWDIFAHMVPLVKARLDAIAHEGTMTWTCAEYPERGYKFLISFNGFYYSLDWIQLFIYDDLSDGWWQDERYSTLEYISINNILVKV
jgi:hypothetical protein